MSLQIKAHEFWEAAGGLSTFSETPKRKQNCYSAPVRGNGGRVAVYERATFGYAMVEVSRKIAQEWDKMGVDYENKEGEHQSRKDGARWNLYMDDKEQMLTWAQNLADAVRRLKGGE